MIKKKTVSIIVPVYNVEKYIDECVLSIINQTYKNLEIFLINDGSTDKSGDICDRYANTDSRIHVIHKENGGQSSARNTALNQITGEYLYFCDSDDYIELDTIERYVDIISNTNVDIVVGSNVFFQSNTKNKKRVKLNEKLYIFDSIEALENMLSIKNISVSPWGKLYKANLYKEIRFPVGKIYEDLATTPYVMAKSKEVAYINDHSYYYRVRKGSTIHTKATIKEMELLDIVDKVALDMKTLDNRLFMPSLKLKIITYLRVYRDILDVGFNKFQDEQERIKSEVIKHKRTLLESKYATRTDKIKLIFFSFGKLPFFIVTKLGMLMHNIKETLL